MFADCPCPLGPQLGDFLLVSWLRCIQQHLRKSSPMTLPMGFPAVEEFQLHHSAEHRSNIVHVCVVLSGHIGVELGLAGNVTHSSGLQCLLHH